MVFDIHQLDDLEDWSGEAATEWAGELHQRFLDSPEGQGLLERDEYPGYWAHQLLRFAQQYLRCPLPDLDLPAMEEIMEELFPAKASVLTREETELAIPELQAFWRYLGREHGLTQASDMIRYLQRIAPEFVDWMFDPERYGLAKSVVMLGHAAGLDMTDPEQAREFVALYNAARREVLGGTAAEGPEGSASARSRAEQAKRRRRGKAARSARRRQRK